MTAYQAFLSICNNASLIGNYELESILATDTHYSYLYAYEIIKNRFQVGEYAISQCMTHIYYYLTTVPNTNSIEFVLEVLSSRYRDDYIEWYFRSKI